MSKKQTFLITSYGDPEEAVRTLRKLRRSSLSDQQVGLLVRDDKHKTHFQSVQEFASEDDDNKAGVTAAAGAAAGAGGGALWALGIAAGFLPAIGPVVSGGILGAILASAGTGAVAGGIVGSLVGLGISDEDAEFVSREIESGSTIVVIKNPDDHEESIRLLDNASASFAPSIQLPTPGRATDIQPVL